MKGWIYLQLSGTSALRPDIQGLMKYQHLHGGRTRGVNFFCKPPPPLGQKYGILGGLGKHDNLLRRKKSKNKGEKRTKKWRIRGNFHCTREKI